MTEFLKKLSKTEIRAIVTIMDTLFCYGLVFMILTNNIPDKNRDLAIQLVTMVVAGTIILNRNFLFGSSKTEADKGKNNTDE